MHFENPAALIDHTLLKADARSDQVRQLCEEAVEYGFASVCIPPSYVAVAADILYGSEVAVGTVVGFPLGYANSLVKAFEAQDAVRKGAAEIDMVIHVGTALEGRHDEVLNDIRQVVTAADGARVKVILECCYLADTLKTDLARLVVEGGAAYVKTSTGFGPGGATEADVALLAGVVAGRIGVKAAGGIRNWETCHRMLVAGATRIGTSGGVAIVDQWRRQRDL
ncbi:deoxyribose-phosphate aldolase [Desulfuromonas sp. AOP6]|uniref:deoxyribose-phosphate aldolase n=1 Tax=Desulfuromonas sp. AOP6 TaxID=1566351 RepID=UPI001272274E|nr:deoxyribose-phosphate aldolase [Desulfuromonas sp. AOP6]BCA80279.1 deoxyribose-phosphate aldolase [Desulfuromonas sp. AOP6]